MSTLKTLGIFSIGAGVGAFVMYKYLNNKLDQRLAEELDAMKEFYENSGKPAVDKIKEKVADAADTLNEAGAAAGKKFRATLEKAGYDTFFKNEANDISEDEDEELAESEHPQDDKPEPQPPYLISSEEFFHSHYEKTSLTYYESVDVLTEEDDILENIEYIVGDEFRDHFGDEEEDVVYVRNEKFGTDYEIILNHSDPDTVQEILGYEGGSED